MRNKRKKVNDKGFSLVEVIVVIAIIGILSVTLAPRLTHYLEKAKYASDQAALNAIYTAAKLADITYPYSATDDMLLGSKDGTTVYHFNEDRDEWKINPNLLKSTFNDLNFTSELANSLESFTLKAKGVNKDTQIRIGKISNEIFVFLDYDGDNKITGDDIVLPEHLKAQLIADKNKSDK